MWGMVLPYLPFQLAWFQTFCSKKILSTKSFQKSSKPALHRKGCHTSKHSPRTSLPFMIECAQLFCSFLFLATYHCSGVSEAYSRDWWGLLPGHDCVTAPFLPRLATTWQWRMAGADLHHCKRKKDSWLCIPQDCFSTRFSHFLSIALSSPYALFLTRFSRRMHFILDFIFPRNH